ncbi:MAG: hypothetical protein OTJ45_00460 [Alphaproteobacteria bacterium]|nr:hypothetical protein [Alphaproteobacteria bacterium]
MITHDETVPIARTDWVFEIELGEPLRTWRECLGLKQRHPTGYRCGTDVHVNGCPVFEIALFRGEHTEPCVEPLHRLSTRRSDDQITTFHIIFGKVRPDDVERAALSLLPLCGRLTVGMEATQAHRVASQL